MNVKIDLPLARQEFGFTRTTCGCKKCQVWCKWQPGFLVPSDLERLIPHGEDPFLWAEEHLRASPGLRIDFGELTVSVPSLVPAKQENGHCHWFQDGQCLVHANSPYGCAFLDQHLSNKEGALRCHPARLARAEAFKDGSLYAQIWQHLEKKGLTYDTGRTDRERAITAIRKLDKWAMIAESRKRRKNQRRLRRRAG